MKPLALLVAALAGILPIARALAQDGGYRYYYYDDRRPYAYPGDPSRGQRYYYDRRTYAYPRDPDYDSRYVEPPPRREPAPAPRRSREPAPDVVAIPDWPAAEELPSALRELTTMPMAIAPEPAAVGGASLPLAQPPAPKIAEVAPPATKLAKASPPQPTGVAASTRPPKAGKARAAPASHPEPKVAAIPRASPAPKVAAIAPLAPKVAAVPLRAPKVAAIRPPAHMGTAVSLRTGRYTLAARELFEFDDYALRGRQAKLDEIARMMKSDPDIAVRITAYTDRLGTDSYNLKLSRLRAEAVRDYLVERGVPGPRLKAVGRGNAEPVVHCGDDGGEWDQKALDLCLEPNRRIEIERIGAERSAAAPSS
jgi:outer membrane protein OmpA-like peptidoglycan-associated protein